MERDFSSLVASLIQSKVSRTRMCLAGIKNNKPFVETYTTPPESYLKIFF
jgi:hypothetical protein